jgi:hypothetical protein
MSGRGTIPTVRTITAGQPASQYELDTNIRAYDVSPHDKRFVFVRAATSGNRH